MRVASISSRFLDACRRRPTDVRPVWFMRQAGRSLPEYLKVREGTTMLESCLDPALAAEQRGSKRDYCAVCWSSHLRRNDRPDWRRLEGLDDVAVGGGEFSGVHHGALSLPTGRQAVRKRPELAP